MANLLAGDPRHAESGEIWPNAIDCFPRGTYLSNDGCPSSAAPRGRDRSTVNVTGKDLIDRGYRNSEIDIVDEGTAKLSEAVYGSQIARHRIELPDAAISKINHPQTRFPRDTDHNNFGHIATLTPLIKNRPFSAPHDKDLSAIVP
ncbi:hypothetical protein M728_001655 [Ensifer sp. WSM1721]